MTSTVPARGLATAVAVAVAALVVAGSAPATVDAGAGATAAGSAGGSGVAAAADGAANNSTVPRHRNPASADRAGDLSATGEWLARRLAARLGEGTARVERGQYEAARRVVGDRFDARLARLVEVAGETEGTADDRLAGTLTRTRDRQRRFADAVADYRETRRAYRAARRAGEEARARRLARELRRLSGTVDRTGDALVDDYETLSNETGADLGDAAAGVRSVRRNVTERQAAVGAETFVATRLEVAAPARPVSFVDPLAVRGRLLAENGTALANRSIRLRVGRRTLRARTNATGGFLVAHRPVEIAANATSVQVRYRPRNASVYLGSATSVPVTVRPVHPTVTVAATPSPVGFGDGLSVAGRVTAGGVGVASVPVVVRVGGTRLGRVETGPSGSFSVSAPLPAGVAAGDRRVEAAVALSGRAVAATNASAGVTVRPTPADLAVSARPAGEGASVEVTGRLTAGGRPAAGRRVALRANGSIVRTVRTDADGRYSARVPRRLVGTAGVVEVTAVHDGAGSNLGDATARATVRLSAGPSAGDGGVVARVAGRPVVLALGALVAGLVAAVAIRRRGSADADEPEEQSRPPSSEAAPLSAAWDRLDAGDHAGAVGGAYAAVRRRLPVDAGAGARTHWEFYEAVRATDPDRAGALRRLTEAYEQAAFAPGPTDRDAAADALAAAEELVG